MFGNEGGTTGVDDDFAARGFSNIGTWIMGRNTFGPIRGPRPDAKMCGTCGRAKRHSCGFKKWGIHIITVKPSAKGAKGRKYQGMPEIC